MWNDYRKEIDSIHLDGNIKESLKYKIENQEKKCFYKKSAFQFTCVCILMLSVITLYLVQRNFNRLVVVNESSTVEYDTSTYITKEMKIAMHNNVYDFIKKEGQFITGMANTFDYVVLATVISNDKADTKLPSGHKNPIGYTFSSVLVQKTYKGKLLDNQVLQTIKEGGIFSVEEIFGTVDDQKELGEGYVNTTPENDVMLEEGKTYLLCLKYNSKEKKYEIIGRNVGIREAKIPKTRKVKKVDYKDVKVKNNQANIFEPIEEACNNLE